MYIFFTMITNAYGMCLTANYITYYQIIYNGFKLATTGRYCLLVKKTRVCCICITEQLMTQKFCKFKTIFSYVTLTL